MNLDPENELASRVDRELKGLPLLSAPEELRARIMEVVEARSRAPWYRRSWPTWSPVLRIASLALLVSLFAGICLGAGTVYQSAVSTAVAQQLNGWLNVAGVCWRTLAVLGSAIGTALGRAGTGLFLAWLVALAAGCALFAGVGKVYLRLGWARTQLERIE